MVSLLCRFSCYSVWEQPTAGVESVRVSQSEERQTLSPRDRCLRYTGGSQHVCWWVSYLLLLLLLLLFIKIYQHKREITSCIQIYWHVWTLCPIIYWLIIKSISPDTIKWFHLSDYSHCFSTNILLGIITDSVCFYVWQSATVTIFLNPVITNPYRSPYFFII